MLCVPPAFNVSHEILKTCSPLRLGYVYGKVSNGEKDVSLWDAIEKRVSEVENRIRLEQIRNIPGISSTRDAYKALGKDPSRYRPSAEALFRRIVKGQGLYQLNCIVDLINYLSLESGFSIGGYDAEKISGSLTLRKGSKDDIYLAIGRGELNVENLPVLCDDVGPIGSPTSDSERTSISIDSHYVLLVFFDFDVHENLDKWLETAVDLLMAYAGASQIQKDSRLFVSAN